jgi:soluble lytic murein transglycosylase-like protein
LFAIFAGFVVGIPALPATTYAGSDATVEHHRSLPAPAVTQADVAPSAEPGVPSVLNTLDAARYVAIFELQGEGNWKAADGYIEALKDKTLLGDVQAERYLSARYSASFTELREWLLHYADLPDARAVWVLAKKRAPGQTVPAPMPATAQVAEPIDPAVAARDAGAAPLPPEPPSIVPETPSRFEAGLVAWRAKRWGEAASDFEAVAHGADTSSWYVAAGAFWAARAHLVQNQPAKVDPLLALAAEQPRSFYGMLARRLLGSPADPRFVRQPLSLTEMAQLQALPGGRRALALVQISQTDRAEAELRALSTRSNKDLASALMALADLANMPELCIALDRQMKNDPRHIDARYPVPRWQPRDGFSIDRALMFALMMQESGFNAEAQSGSGAAGLMQLMPATARMVAHEAGIPLRSVTDLVDPVVNLSLGQEYVKQLLAYDQINGNLIMLLAAYNSGTAPLAKLQAEPEFKNDPLLFIEALPRETTRLYVQRVLTNMWIYRQRLGQDAPDLDALAANRWPSYVSMNAQLPGAR